MGYTPPWLDIRKVAGGWSLSGTGATTDDTTITANPTDAKPYIELLGGDTVNIYVNGGSTCAIVDGTAGGIVGFKFATPDSVIQSYNNQNILLSPNGTGKVKFGTFTGSGDVAVNGSISILDSGGSARKLATVA